MSGVVDVRLLGPGGAGKSTTGALLAERLGTHFVDLDRQLARNVGDISDYISRHGYQVYVRENIDSYCSLLRKGHPVGVVALSSGFMTYASDSHPEYAQVRRDLAVHAQTFVLLPSLDREVSVAETVCRQIARPFGRSAEREEAVIRARFDVYMSLRARKIETMRPVDEIADEIVSALSRDA